MSKAHNFFTARAKRGPIGEFSPAVEDFLLKKIGWLIRLFSRPEAQGFNRLPSDRAYLLVANHSGGGGYEILVLAWLWLKQFGRTRKITGMAHPVSFSIPGAASLLYNVGAIPAVYDEGVNALKNGIPVVTFPGGDYEAFRPFWQANTVDFNDRKGFLRMAREANVPIVPVGIRGSHYTNPFLWRSELLTWFTGNRYLGIKRIGISVLGVVGALIIGGLLYPTIGLWAVALGLVWIGSPVSVLAPIFPSKITMHIGKPIEPDELFSDEDDSLANAYQLVVDRIQVLVNE